MSENMLIRTVTQELQVMNQEAAIRDFKGDENRGPMYEYLNISTITCNYPALNH